jgi:cytoskeletal protein CcmA (bactofilin family)
MAESGARGLDVYDPSPPRSSRMPAADVLRGVGEPDVAGNWRLPRRRTNAPPVIRVVDKFLTGVLDLRAVELNYLLEFERCRFEQPPDLRQSKLAGIDFRQCWLPGLAGRNLTSANDVALDGCRVEGPVDLTDSDIAGSVLLRTCTLRAPGELALHADRMKVAGALLAYGIRTEGEVRVAGAQISGNCNFSGAVLHNPGGFSLNGNGMRVGGNLLCGVWAETDQHFTAHGTVMLPNATISSAFTMRRAALHAGDDRAEPDLVDPHADPHASLVLDRITVSGDVELDRGFTSAGTLRMLNAGIGGTLSLAGAKLDAVKPPGGNTDPVGRGRAVHLDGAEIGGDIAGRELVVKGQFRMVDATVRGSLVLDGSTLENPHADTVLANRCRVGSNFSAREADVAGVFELRAVHIGANLDLRGSRLIQPGKYRHQPGEKASVDIGGATIGRDLICAKGSKEFVAHGGVRTRRAQIGRTANFAGAVLGDKLDSHALNALGMQVPELVLTVVSPPKGKVTLRGAGCTSLEDNETFWSATGRIDLEDFRYDSLRHSIDLRDDASVLRRLRWLRQAMRHRYRPGPYDQLAALLRASGNDEHASTVLMEKQRLRYIAVAEGTRLVGPLVLLWSWLQRWMVGYGYRPGRALGWLVVSWILGSAYFAVGPPMKVINSGDTLEWNPWLFTIDLVVPIVDFGNKNRWQTPGAAQWIASGLIVSGWTLATTVAAGLTRMLKR